MVGDYYGPVPLCRRTGLAVSPGSCSAENYSGRHLEELVAGCSCCWTTVGCAGSQEEVLMAYPPGDSFRCLVFF